MVSLSIYLYLAILLGISLILIFVAISIIRHRPEINFYKVLVYFVLIFWLLTLPRWFSIQGRWLINDFSDFKEKPLVLRRAQVTAKIISHSGFSKAWEDYYEFLEFARREIPQGATCYIAPSEKTMVLWAHYWLYPDLKVVEEGARYILAFNVSSENVPPEFEYFKEFASNKFILKVKND